MTGSVTTLDGQAYSALTAYDDLGRAWRSQDPSSAWLKTEFDARGYAVRLCDSSASDTGSTCASGSPSTWRETLETDARGNVLSERRGGTDALLLTRFFEASTGRLLDQCAGITCNLLDENYSWDAAGNLTARDKAGQYSETFSYDPLNRLIGTQTSRADGLGGSMVVASTAQTYDKLGNICSKTIAGQVQDYTYGGPAGCGINVAAGSGGDFGSPHAVTQTNDGNFHYDEHGNQTQASYTEPSKNRTIDYSAADQANQIRMGDEYAPSLRTRFWYGSDGSRYKREDDTPSSTTKRTLYVGNLEIVSQGGITTYKRYVAGVMVQDVTGSAVTNQFLFHDHIGSVIRAVSANGAVIEGMDYGAFGERRGYIDPTLPAAVPQTTTRGFTGHEMIDGTDVVHMNGRIYDSKLGRFLQADPVIQEPNNPQNFNRYTYVLNNPLSLTDPSGFSFLGKAFKFLRPLVAIAITYYTGGLALAATGWASVGWTVAGGFAAGVVSSGTLKGGLIGAFTAVAFLGAGKLATSVQANTFGRAALHGLAGGVLSSVQGGSFGHGFVQAGLSKAASAYGPSFGNDYADGVLAAIEGGTISELTGGKFINGAQTAAMQFAYNALVQRADAAVRSSLKNKEIRIGRLGKDGKFEAFGRALNEAESVGLGSLQQGVNDVADALRDGAGTIGDLATFAQTQFFFDPDQAQAGNAINSSRNGPSITFGSAAIGFVSERGFDAPVYYFGLSISGGGRGTIFAIVGHEFGHLSGEGKATVAFFRKFGNAASGPVEFAASKYFVNKIAPHSSVDVSKVRCDDCDK